MFRFEVHKLLFLTTGGISMQYFAYCKDNLIHWSVSDNLNEKQWATGICHFLERGQEY